MKRDTVRGIDTDATNSLSRIAIPAWVFSSRCGPSNSSCADARVVAGSEDDASEEKDAAEDRRERGGELRRTVELGWLPEALEAESQWQPLEPSVSGCH